MEVRFFDDSVERFIYQLQKPVRAKVLRTMNLLERFGSLLGMPHSKSIGHALFELRIHGRQEVRLLYEFHDGNALLLHGFIKTSRRLPENELLIALRRKRALDSI